jgi:polysaccharide pyruvyl transferase
MQPTDSSPRVLMVGAYERDNVGDLLFLLVTERYLPDAQVISAAPFSADMTALLDRRVHAYGPLLRSERFDVIWTAGGQVGAVDLRRAFRMSAPPGAYRRYRRSSERKRAAILRRAVGGATVVSPYIPSPLAYPLNAGAISVLNSAGLSGIRRIDPQRRELLVALLRGQTFISVRDRPSSRFLAGLGIEHSLVPDAVHAIGVLRPRPRDPDSDVAILQASTAILGRLGLETVAAGIAGSRSLKGLRLRLLPAGTATGHDSIADYEALIDHVKRSAPGTDIEILEARRPLELVDHISRARVVVGTSLHVRIIACAYGLPRVTLSRYKPTKYALTWDPDMPFDVPVEGLDAAIEAALASAERPEVAARSAELSRRAHEHLTDLADRVMTLATTEKARDRARRLERRRAQQVGEPAECAA